MLSKQASKLMDMTTQVWKKIETSGFFVIDWFLKMLELCCSWCLCVKEKAAKKGKNTIFYTKIVFIWATIRKMNWNPKLKCLILTPIMFLSASLTIMDITFFYYYYYYFIIPIWTVFQWLLTINNLQLYKKFLLSSNFALHMLNSLLKFQHTKTFRGKCALVGHTWPRFY